MPKDEILTAYAEHAKGPGWSNDVLWVIVRRFEPMGFGGWRLFLEAIQPEEHNDEIRTLFNISAALNKEIVEAVKNR
jgi:hypothetical protein